MKISGTGIQQILPRTGTGWQGSNPPPDRPDDGDHDEAAGESSPAKPGPGTGQVVDRIA
jgi:hypothetical protein